MPEKAIFILGPVTHSGSTGDHPYREVRAMLGPCPSLRAAKRVIEETAPHHAFAEFLVVPTDLVTVDRTGHRILRDPAAMSCGQRHRPAAMTASRRK